MPRARRGRFGFGLTLAALGLALLSCRAVMGAPPVAPAPVVTLPAALTPPPTEAATSGSPRATPDSTRRPAPTETAVHYVALNAAQQRAVFLDLWQVIDEQYLYPDFNGLDLEAVRRDTLAQIDAGLSTPDFYAAMQAVVDSLGDDHSTYFTPPEAREEDAQYAGESTYTGIGVMTSVVLERDRLVVLAVMTDSPAEEAGLRVHDSILEADGQKLVENGSSAEPILRRELLRGPEGSQVILLVASPGETPRQVTLTRRSIQSATPVPYELIVTPAGQRIGYILLVTFNDETVPAKVEQALEALQVDGPLDGLILDNRVNEGGADTVLLGTLRYFVDGRVGYFVNREEETPLRTRLQAVGNSADVPLVVLVGQETVSFGEIFAGILQDLGRATIMGETTDGNVEVLSIYDFEDGSRAWIAHDTFRPLNRSDQNWERDGIVPDQIVPSAWDLYTTTTDPAVLAALAHFGG